MSFAPLLAIALYTLSAILASLFFYFSYKVLKLFNLPQERETRGTLREQYGQILRYESIHLALSLLYLIGVGGCLLIPPESVQSMKLTFAQIGTSLVIVLYPLVDMRRIMTKKKSQIEAVFHEKSLEIFEESMKRLEVDFFKGKRQEEIRAVFADFRVFPFDQLMAYVAELGQGDDEYDEGGKEILVQAWIKERVNLVNEYKQFYQSSSYTVSSEA